MRTKRFIVFSIASAIFVFSPIHLLRAQTNITTDVVSNTTWTLAQSPYVISSSIMVAPGATLTIEPGVIIKADNHVSISAFGTIVASGTDVFPITFTSLLDDTVGGDTNSDGSHTSPTVNDWDGLVFLGSDLQKISHVVLRYVKTALDFHGGANSIDHLTCFFTKQCLLFTGAEGIIDTLLVDHPSGESMSLLGGSQVTLSHAVFTNLDTGSLFSTFLDSTLTVSDIQVGEMPRAAEAMSVFLDSALSIDHGAFADFHTTLDAASVFNHSTLSLSHTNLLGSGTGDGIQVFSDAKVSFDHGKISNFGGAGIAIFGNETDPVNELHLSNSIISYNGTGIFATADPVVTTDTVSIHDNRDLGVEHYGALPLALPNIWWGDATGPHNAINNSPGLGSGVDDSILFTPYLTEDPFHEVVIPSTYYAKITGLTQGFANIRETPDATGVLLKTLPIDYIVHIVARTDENNQPIISDGYRWNKVEDPNDLTIGWMIAGPSTTTAPLYLPYLSDTQAEYITTAATHYDGNVNTASRRDIITQALDHYLTNTSTKKSLYSSDDGIKISDLASGMPKELILAIIAQESGGSKFNNEIVSFDYGHGDMQITPNYYSHEEYKKYNENSSQVLGKYSNLKNILCLSDKSDNYKKCYQNMTEKPNKISKPYDFYDHNSANQKYKQYANTTQSIYANIKDGLGILTEKYKLAFASNCKKGSYIVESETFTCDDLRKIKTVWAYNGVVTTSTNNYLELISQKLASLPSYFPGYSYDDSDHLIEKLAIANRHRNEIRVHSPVALQVTDVNTDETTGLLDDEVIENIDNSVYDPDTEGVLVLFPEDTYQYNLVGTENSSYGFEVHETDTSGTLQQIFSATDVPVINGAVHTITLDEPLLAQGGDGAMLTMDNDADGVIDRTVVGSTTFGDLLPPTISFGRVLPVYPLGSVISLKKIATDNSTPAPELSLVATANGTPLPIINNTVRWPLVGDGTFSLTATDTAGNSATSATPIHGNYIFSGIALSPATANNTYKKGANVSIHFVLRGKGGILVPVDHPGVTIIRNTDGYSAPINPDVTDENGMCDLGESCFSRVNNAYKFLLKTTLLDLGTWTITIRLQDGNTYTAPLLIQ